MTEPSDDVATPREPTLIERKRLEAAEKERRDRRNALRRARRRRATRPAGDTAPKPVHTAAADPTATVRIVRVQQPTGGWLEVEVAADETALCPTCRERLHLELVLDHLGVWARRGGRVPQRVADEIAGRVDGQWVRGGADWDRVAW